MALAQAYSSPQTKAMAVVFTVQEIISFVSCSTTVHLSLSRLLGLTALYKHLAKHRSKQRTYSGDTKTKVRRSGASRPSSFE